MKGFQSDRTRDDRIYEAAVVPELWPEVLDQIARECGAAGGIIITGYPNEIRWVASENLRTLMMRGLSEGWMDLNSRAPRAAAYEHAGFIGDLDLFEENEIAVDPFYGFLRSSGFGWCTGTVIPDPEGSLTIFNWERRTQDGPVDRPTMRSLDRLRPHLGRAALIAKRLGLERARNAAETLNQLGLPAAILSKSGRVFAMNELLCKSIPVVVEDRRERLRIMNGQADNLFQKALTHSFDLDGPSYPLSIPIAREGTRHPMILHMIPIVRNANDIFGGASWITVLTAVKPSPSPGQAVVRGLYDLTPAEARVACEIAEARSVEEISWKSGVSPETVRSQLKSIFGKTGTARQSELVSLLTGLVLPFT